MNFNKTYNNIFLLGSLYTLITIISFGSDLNLLEGKDYIVVARDGGAGGYEAFPDICRLPDGRLLCVFYAGYDHVSLPTDKIKKGGKIAGCFSSDEGKTWSEPFTIFDSEYDDRDPSIAFVSGGRLICNFFSLKPSGENWEGLGTSVIFSDDLGITWSKAITVSRTYYTSSPIRELPNGDIVISLYAGEDKKGCGAVAFSNDRGITWSTPIDIDPGKLKLDAEPDICIIDSKIYIVQRGQNSEPMGYAISNDLGRTWTISASLGFPGHCPYLHKTNSGIIILGIRDPAKKGTYIRLSSDGAKTWSEPILVDNCIGAYPSMVNLKDGSVLIVYYEEGNSSNIRARKFRIGEGNEVKWLFWN
ncbi:MAG: glycoside hydrolase [Candidatus Hydrogenedentes bacterium]|nr:glycoside hydrolase [Candidatus Hydrogenedentota bacterium]